LLATNIPMALYMSLVHQVSYSLFTEYWDYIFIFVIVCSSYFCINLNKNVYYICYSFSQQRGPEDVMNHLAREATQGNVKSILFLTPCHATPYYSMLHHNLPMQFLDCTPRFGINNYRMASKILIKTKISS
jgi:hypothetical protein